MNAMQYWEAVGSEKVIEACAQAGTGYEYFKHIAHGRKKPSFQLASRLSAASVNLGEDDAGAVMTVSDLLGGAALCECCGQPVKAGA
jgi:hypothetical protein